MRDRKLFYTIVSAVASAFTLLLAYVGATRIEVHKLIVRHGELVWDSSVNWPMVGNSIFWLVVSILLGWLAYRLWKKSERFQEKKENEANR
jgi:hypothetical protein